MKKKFLCLMLTLVMVFSLVPSAVAANDEATQAAQTLYELGLFKGTGTNPDGTPIFALEQTPTRNQAVIMLVRLLGKEEEALAGNWELPFADVAKGSTAYPYIGYAYANGLTSGTTATTYSGTNPIKANPYITFVLRALGYESGKDFQVGTSYLLSDQLGITSGEYANASAFTRGDVAKISLNAHEVQEVVATAPYWGLPANIRWISEPKTEADLDNNILYSFLFGNYSLNFSNIGTTEEADAPTLINTMRTRIKALSITYPELAGVFSNTFIGCGANPDGVFIDFPQSSLSIEEIYVQQIGALGAAQAIQNELHERGKITDDMTQKQIAQVYYDHLRGMNVSVGGGPEAAKQGKSVEFDSPYACLVLKKADCVGRAGAFNLLMHLEGISAQGVGGSIKGTDTGHVLNRVILDGETYYCDWGNNHPLAQNIDSWFIFD